MRFILNSRHGIIKRSVFCLSRMSFVVFLFFTIVKVFSSAEHAHSKSNYVCPIWFTPIGRKCYHFSTEAETWQEAHYKCLNINSTLAVITKSHQESLLRNHLNNRPDIFGKYQRWIGGLYNWQQNKWIWGISGKPLVFQAFSRINQQTKEKWKWTCIIIDPDRQNKWAALSCVEKRRYICQTTVNKSVMLKQKTNNHFDKSRCLKNANSSECVKYSNKIYRHSNEAAALTYPHLKRKRIMKDFICPSHMILVGRKCYFFSIDTLPWHEAYWACRENKTKLAIIINKQQDDILRGFLNRNFVEKQERWIGGIYDWIQTQWKWAQTGEAIQYMNFPKNIVHKSNWNCLTLDPQFQHRWNSKNQVDSKRYICQVKAKSIIKYGRKPKILKKFNNTTN